MRIAYCLCIGLPFLLPATPTRAAGFASSPNFMVIADEQATADAVLGRAESLRKALAHQWLGRELPEGDGRTVLTLRVHPTDNLSEFCPGADPCKSLHLLRIVAPRDELLGSTLNHETCHLVLHVGHKDKLPRWLDEGLAMFQDTDRHGPHSRVVMQRCVETSSWPNLAPVLDARTLDGSFTAYAMSHYFTAFLLGEKDARTLFDFAKTGQQKGWDTAARQCYGRSLAKLEADWHTWTPQALSRNQLALRLETRAN